MHASTDADKSPSLHIESQGVHICSVYWTNTSETKIIVVLRQQCPSVTVAAARIVTSTSTGNADFSSKLAHV